MMNCKFQPHNGRLVCPACNRSIADPGKPVFWRCQVHPGPTRDRGFGDMVAAVLTWLGITPARWAEWTRWRVIGGQATAVLIKDESIGCGCKERKKLLNQVWPW